MAISMDDRWPSHEHGQLHLLETYITPFYYLRWE